MDAVVQCFDGIDPATKQRVSLGTLYSAAWASPTTLVIKIADASGAAPPKVDHSVFLASASANVRHAYYPSPPAASFSPALTGTFALVPLFLSVEAVNVPGDGAYGSGDVLKLRFSTATNLGGGVARCDPASGGAAGLILRHKPEVDALVTPSQNLGADYSGLWVSSAELWITILNATGAVPAPVIGQLTFQVRATANLKNAAETSGSSTAVSMPVTGVFAAPPSIVKIFAAPGGGRLGGHPTVVLFFDFPTQPGVNQRVWGQAQLDYALDFSLHLGALYQASWSDPYSLVIEIIDPDRSQLCTAAAASAASSSSG